MSTLLTRTSRARALGAGALLLLAGCRLGTHPGDFAPAVRAEGITATVTTPGQSVIGELLELRDSALVVLGTEVVLVPERLIDRATFTGTRLSMAKGFPMAPADRAQLRLFSRYPYGIPEGVMPKLLTSRKQAAIVVIEK